MHQKWDNLLEQFKQLDNCLIAYSGGTDSTLLLRAAAESKIRSLAVTVRSEVFPQTMLAVAENRARELGIPHKVVDFDIFQIHGFASNPPDRCYHCKKNLLQLLKKVAEQYSCKYVVDGTNADDINDYRPGLKALSEEGITSPLQEAGLTKEEIVALSREYNLPVIPGDACLASRVPYGEYITAAKLEQVEMGETLLHNLGIKHCRVRHHGSIARIEVPAECLASLIDPAVRKSLSDYFENLGFTYTAIDLRGYVTGSMNKLLEKET